MKFTLDVYHIYFNLHFCPSGKSSQGEELFQAGLVFASQTRIENKQDYFKLVTI